MLGSCEIEYTRNGRMKYNPEYFGNSHQPWIQDELDYLINWYDTIGSEELAFALERTQNSIMAMVRELRKDGTMIKPEKIKYRKRIFSVRSERVGEVI